MSIPRSDQSSWSTHWPRPRQCQTHCIQWIPYTSIWCTPRTHHLAARLPWCSPPQGKIILVHCRHPWSPILGLPSSEKLAVVKMNCAITIKQPSTHPPPVSPTVATNKPATAPEAAKPIQSTDDLIKEFQDQLKGIGRFPSKYKIGLCHDAHLVIHAPRKCPITLHPKVKEHLNKMECLGMITRVDEPMDWVSSITYFQKGKW